MGYPMTYQRVIGRSHLQGDYGCPSTALQLIAGDLRRLEKNQRDEAHLKQYAARAGITEEQAKEVLDAFFAGEF
jgi:hypothetical protein